MWLEPHAPVPVRQGEGVTTWTGGGCTARRARGPTARRACFLILKASASGFDYDQAANRAERRACSTATRELIELKNDYGVPVVSPSPSLVRCARGLEEGGAVAAPREAPATRRTQSEPQASERRDMDKFLALTFAGLCTAGIYAIAASGLVLTYTTTGVFNFAHGAIGMLGAFVYWQSARVLGLCRRLVALSHRAVRHRAGVRRRARGRDHAAITGHVGGHQLVVTVTCSPRRSGWPLALEPAGVAPARALLGGQQDLGRPRQRDVALVFAFFVAIAGRARSAAAAVPDARRHRPCGRRSTTARWSRSTAASPTARRCSPGPSAARWPRSPASSPRRTRACRPC